MRQAQIAQLAAIDERTSQIAADLAAITCTLRELRSDVDELRLAQARQQGQLDLVWKVATLLGIPGIIALIKTFTDSAHITP
jgi:hypothetical protein